MSPPLPPADLQSKLQIVSIAVRSEMHRVYTSTFEPVHFDRSDLSRFNAPDGSCGVRCMAWKFEGVFAETFLQTPGNTLTDIGFLERKICKGVSATEGRPRSPDCRGLAVADKTAWRFPFCPALSRAAGMDLPGCRVRDLDQVRKAGLYPPLSPRDWARRGSRVRLAERNGREPAPLVKRAAELAANSAG